MTNIPLVLLFGSLFSIQNHLAKALERQGIEFWDQFKARIQKRESSHFAGGKKPIIYIIGVILNNTVFIWSTLAQPYGPPALFSSMYGIGLVFLMLYAASILKERINRVEYLGATGVLAGTLVIGVENVSRAGMNRFNMDLSSLFILLGVWLVLSLFFVFAASRSTNLHLIALAFGMLAGGLGSLDPFLKGVGQNYGGQPGIIPSNPIGGVIFAVSFVIGFLSFVVVQIGFAHKVRASLLVPTYNAAYIGLPILWQVTLLADYQLTWVTVSGIGLILAGVMGMQPLKDPNGQPSH